MLDGARAAVPGVRPEGVVRLLELVVLLLAERDRLDRVLQGLFEVAGALLLPLAVELEEVRGALVHG